MEGNGNYLLVKLRDAKVTVRWGIGLILLPLCLITFLVYEISSNVDTHDFSYLENIPAWISVISVAALAAFIIGAKLLSKGIANQRTYEKIRQEDVVENLRLTVTDKYQYLSLLPGDEGGLKSMFYLVTKEGRWLMSPTVSGQFTHLSPQTVVMVSALSHPYYKEIYELEILESRMIDSPLTKHTNIKLISEVKVTGIINGKLLINKFHLFKKVRYYHISDESVKEVSDREFLDL